MNKAETEDDGFNLNQFDYDQSSLTYGLSHSSHTDGCQITCLVLLSKCCMVFEVYMVDLYTSYVLAASWSWRFNSTHRMFEGAAANVYGSHVIYFAVLAAACCSHCPIEVHFRFCPTSAVPGDACGDPGLCCPHHSLICLGLGSVFRRVLCLKYASLV